MKYPLHFLLAAVALVLCSCENSRKPKYTVTVHLQATSTDNPREIINATVMGQPLVFKKVPEFGTRAIGAFKSFPADNGAANGLLLRLDAHGRNQLETTTRMNEGSLLLSVVNGVPVDITQIDRPIADGMFTIWQGVSDETIALMEKKLPNLSSNTQSSDRLEMTPTTIKEKKEARKAELEMKKYNEDMARRVERGEDINAPRTKEIPLE